jgi:hypothetical protein
MVLLILALTLKFSGLDAFLVTSGTSIRHTFSTTFTPTSFDLDHGHGRNINVTTRSYQTSFHNNAAIVHDSLRGKLGGPIRRGGNRDGTQPQLYQFSYDCDELSINTFGSNSTTGVILIHPIGVGISKWYYDRLLHSLSKQNETSQRLIFLAPDLLGSGSACAPYATANGIDLKVFPLLNITDWSNQITDLMAEYESSVDITNWVVVANGGCSPIALKVAQSSVTNTSLFKAPVTNVILSSPPRLSFFFEPTDPAKVHKSYRTLSGVLGKLFWWYALRRNGKFIQKFSERNLVGDAELLGDKWTPNCIAAARLHNGQSKYSTFAFLAGALQDGCEESLSSLRGSDIKVDFIRGRDVRQNRAKSWFWSRKKKSANSIEKNSRSDPEKEAVRQTIQHFIHKNGNRGQEVFVDGRISLAWEDADGYAKSIIELI